MSKNTVCNIILREFSGKTDPQERSILHQSFDIEILSKGNVVQINGQYRCSPKGIFGQILRRIFHNGAGEKVLRKASISVTGMNYRYKKLRHNCVP